MIFLAELPQPWGAKEYGLFLLAAGALYTVRGIFTKSHDWGYFMGETRPPRKVYFILGICGFVAGGSLLLWWMLSAS